MSSTPAAAASKARWTGCERFGSAIRLQFRERLFGWTDLRLSLLITYFMSLHPALRIRPPAEADFKAWLPLWDGYNAFYGRTGETALPLKATRKTWSRFFDDEDPVFALLAEREGAVVGLVHYLYHRSTTRLEGTCYPWPPCCITRCGARSCAS